MFGINTAEFLIILVVALIVVGPQKLPEIMRSVGKGLAELRRMSMDVKRTIEVEMDRLDEQKRVEEAKKELFPEGPDELTAEQAAAPAQEIQAGPETAASEGVAPETDGPERAASEGVAPEAALAEAAAPELAAELAAGESPAPEAAHPAEVSAEAVQTSGTVEPAQVSAEAMTAETPGAGQAVQASAAAVAKA